jgi:hypothetical protein
MSYIDTFHKNAGETLIKKFERRGMEACYCATKEEAKEMVLSMIPEGSSVTWGGTESMAQAGVCDAIKNGNYNFIDRSSAKNPEEARALYGKMVCADYFLTSTNAFTQEGELVNIDGASNRVACIAHGPAHVIVLASMDKMFTDVENAIKRIHTYACPPNAVRVGANTPCSKTGICGDCLSPDCICCQILTTRYSRIPGRIKVVLCGEKLGF